MKQTMKLKNLLLILLSTFAASFERHHPHRLVLQTLRGGDDTVVNKAATAVTNRFIRGTAEDIKNALLSDWGLKDKFFAGLAIIAAATSTTAMVLESSSLVTFVGWLCITLGTSSVVLQKRLSDVETMRELTNEMRDKVNSLKHANQLLQKENNRLDKSAAKLQKAESDLAAISETQGVSIDKLVAQVTEYKKIQESVKQDLRVKVKQTLLSVVMASDVDQDYQIDPEEVDMLVHRLKSLPNLDFNEERFRKAIKKDNGSLVTFMNDHLQDDAKMEKEKIFSLSTPRDYK